MNSPFNKQHLSILGFLFLIYAGAAFVFPDCGWMNAWLQIGAIALTIVFSTLLTNGSNRKSDEAMQLKLQFQKQQTDKQIEAIRSTTENQIIAIKDSTQIQIQTIRESTRIQIENLQLFTQTTVHAVQTSVEKQINHQSELSEKHLKQASADTERILNGFSEATQKEIENFVQHSEQMIDRLEDIVEKLSVISSDNKQMLENEQRIREIEEQKQIERRNQLELMLQQQQQTLDRYRPALQFCLEDDGVVFIDLKFILNNSGGEAAGIQLEMEFTHSSINYKAKRYTKNISNLRRNQETWFFVTRSRFVKHYDTLYIKAIVWDVNQHQYFAYYQYEYKKNCWFEIQLDSQNLIT